MNIIPYYVTILTLQLFKNSIDTREKLRLNFHSLSVSELLEYKYKSGTWLERPTKKENEGGHNVEEQLWSNFGRNMQLGRGIDNRIRPTCDHISRLIKRM
jgi:hypothetical protein